MEVDHMKELLFLGLVILISCTKEKQNQHKEINLLSPAKISSLDPIHGADLYISMEVGKVYEGLYEFHPFKSPYELMPNLASSLPDVSPDGLTYTFKIRKGVLFHDDVSFPNRKGRELKASDFVYSFKRVADPKLMSKGWWIFDGKIVGLNEWREKYSKLGSTDYNENVQGLLALDDYTLQVKLINPYPQFLYSLTMPYTAVVPKEAVEYYGSEFLNHPVGTGPFILPKFDQSNKIVYHRNPNYREKFIPSSDSDLSKLKVPLVDKVTVHVIVESQPKWLHFNKGKLDLMGIPKDFYDLAVTKDQKISEELSKKGVKLHIKPRLDVSFYAFNHNDPLFKNNIKLRQAMSLAYNREESNKLFFNNSSQIAHGVIPPGLAGYDENFKNPYVEFNLEKAKQLLKEAGYPGGKGLPEIKLESEGDTNNRQISEYFALSMKKIGINVKIGSNTWPELVKKVNTGQYHLYFMGWYADYPDAENFFSILYCPNKAPGSNGSNYCNSKFDEQYKKISTMQNSPERTKLYKEMNEMVSLDVPWIILFNKAGRHLEQGWIKNFVVTEFPQTLIQYLDVDVKMKEELIKNYQ